MHTVEIYTSPYCPYCTRAKSLLDRKGVAYQETDVSMDDKLRSVMTKRAGGCHTVPQIFIDNRHIGGCDALHELDDRGELDPLLA